MRKAARPFKFLCFCIPLLKEDMIFDTRCSGGVPTIYQYRATEIQRISVALVYFDGSRSTVRLSVSGAHGVVSGLAGDVAAGLFHGLLLHAVHHNGRENAKEIGRAHV